MDLGLDIAKLLEAGGPEAQIVGQLTAREVLESIDESGPKRNAVKRISERHHALARQLASGSTKIEASIITGYSVTNVDILSKDPTFRELVTFYREKVSDRVMDLNDQLKGLSADAITAIRDKLEDTPLEDLSFSQLTELSKLGLDRTGFGPQSSQNVNVNVGLASRLEAARKRTAPQIDAQAEEIKDVA